jgi:hypothetical protein
MHEPSAEAHAEALRVLEAPTEHSLDQSPNSAGVYQILCGVQPCQPPPRAGAHPPLQLLGCLLLPFATMQQSHNCWSQQQLTSCARCEAPEQLQSPAFFQRLQTVITDAAATSLPAVLPTW